MLSYTNAEKTSSSQGYRMTFFCRSRDAEAELWEGPRNGPNGAVDIFGADNVRLPWLLSSAAEAQAG